MTDDEARALDRQVALALGWTDIRADHYSGSPGVWYGRPPCVQPGDSPQNIERGISMLPHFSRDIDAAWTVVEYLRDKWTAATDNVSGFDNSFRRPFDDGAFFEMLHRHADRRWPWAFFYVTPEAICRAFLASVGVGNDHAE